MHPPFAVLCTNRHYVCFCVKFYWHYTNGARIFIEIEIKIKIKIEVEVEVVDINSYINNSARIIAEY